MEIAHALACRSHFSIGEALLTPGELIEQAKTLGYKSVALTDTMSVSGMVDLTRQALEAGIKPIVGARIRVVDHPTQKKVAKGEVEPEQNQWFAKVYVKNAAGMAALIALLSKGFSEEYFYYVPRVGVEDLIFALRSGGLIVSTGDLFNLFHHPRYHEILQQLAGAAGTSDTLVELNLIDTPLFATLNEYALIAARTLGLSTILTRPVLYAGRDDADTLDVLTAITGNQKMSAPRRHVPFVRDFALEPPMSFAKRAARARAAIEQVSPGITADAFKQALANMQALVDQIEYVWEKQPVSLPQMAANEFAQLTLLCKQGFAQRLKNPVLGYQPDNLKPYIERLQYELGVLKNMGFERYFLVVRDLTHWSKQAGIMVGPGRGSVGGSLIAFLLGITDVDPIRFGLIFERFINPERLDLPDADLDFMSSRRHEVIEYLTQKYGAERVAGISNYSTLGAASSLRDVGRVFEVDPRELSCSKLIGKGDEDEEELTVLEQAANEVPELAAFRDAHGEVWRHAVKLGGRLRNLGQHAAGVIVAGEPLVNRAVVANRKDESPRVNWDKRVVEDWGLVKMDILGLSTLDILTQAKTLIRERHGIEIDYTALPLDDEKVLDAFGRGDTKGVFQFESSGMAKLLKDLAVGGRLSFDDLSAATSLYRPGPMDSGLLDQYVSVRQGVQEPAYPHASVEEALKETGGVMVYQEQVMRVTQDLAGFSMAKADGVRKAIGKKDLDKMKKFRGEFVAGAVASGMAAYAAESLWDQIEKFAGYSFNKAHAAAYSIISYQTMWTKVHYAAEFYAAALSVLKEEKLPSMVADAQARGVHVVPPDINRSTDRFEISFDEKRDQHVLLTPFSSLKGLSGNTTAAILKAREAGPFASKEEFVSRVERRKCNARHQDVLDRVGAFAEIEPTQLPARHPDRLKDQIELMPGLVVDFVKPDRGLIVDNHIKGELKKLVFDMRHNCNSCSLAGGVHPMMRLGKSPKFMVVSDSPNWSEEQAAKLMEGEASAYLKGAMKQHGLSVNDGYFTTLVKSPKSEKMLTPEQINGCSRFLDHEVKLLKPPIIVALGGSSIRHFVKGAKGGAMELAGKVVYVPELDANIVCGINPGMVSFDSSKQKVLDNIFGLVADLLS